LAGAERGAGGGPVQNHRHTSSRIRLTAPRAGPRDDNLDQVAALEPLRAAAARTAGRSNFILVGIAIFFCVCRRIGIITSCSQRLPSARREIAIRRALAPPIHITTLQFPYETTVIQPELGGLSVSASGATVGSCAAVPGKSGGGLTTSTEIAEWSGRRLFVKSAA